MAMRLANPALRVRKQSEGHQKCLAAFFDVTRMHRVSG